MSVRNQPKSYEVKRHSNEHHPLFYFISFIGIYSPLNVERGNAADKLNGRNINVSFTNNSNVPVEVMVFIFYSDEVTINVTNGLVLRHN